MTELADEKIQQGTELMAVGSYAEAKKAFTEALSEDKKNVEAYIHLGNACMNLGDTPSAVNAFNKALLLAPQQGEILFSIGCAYFLDNNYVEALKYLNRCQENGYQTRELYGVMEVIYADAKDYTQALRCANKAIKLEPLNPEVYLDKVQLYLLQDKPKEALSCLHEVREILPDLGESYLLEIQILTQLEDYDQALTIADLAIRRFPLDLHFLLAKGRVLNYKEDYKQACEVLEGISVEDSDESLDAETLEARSIFKRDVVIQKSIAYAGVEDVDRSIAELQQQVALDEGDGEALYILLTECYASKRDEDVVKYATITLSQQDMEPRYRATAMYYRASALGRLGREEESRKELQDCIIALRSINIGNPGLIDVYVLRAMAHKDLGQFDKALELVDHVINLVPDDPSGYACKMSLLEEMGKGEEAKEARAKAISLNPNFKF